jgi:DNA repair exonuclease SbcCD ATPase subunit
LVRFLLFGNITKYQTQDKIFNKFIPEATKVEVEGCITIDDCDYIIKRTLNRPSLERRTTKSKVNQKVEYYRIINGSKEELEDYADNQQEENSVQTNKKIKEIIGREEDFDLVMSVTDATLDSLIEKKDTERGRLFSRWIGLLPIEEKDALAREKFNQEIKPYLMSNKYDIETVKQEIGAYNVLISDLEKRQKTYKKQNEAIEKEIGQLEESRNTLMQSKQKIDDTLLKIDITTLNRTIETITDEGKKKKFELDKVISEINEIGDVEFSVNAYDNLVSETNKLSVKRGVIAEQYKNLTHNIEHLKSSEFCPTCGKKLDNVDNTAKINELKETLKNITDEGISLKKLIDENEAKINSMKDAREKYTRKSNLTVQKSAYELNIEKLRGQLIEKRNILKEYEKNSEAIDINNKLDIQIRNTELAIKEKRSNKDTNNRYIVNNENIIDQHKKEIAAREELIKKIEEETILVKNWKIYLDMVGKNGISKMVLRKTLPIINARLAQLLSDVCDFDVELDMNARNEVAFFIIKNGIKSDLSGGSGFEKTAASLALRSVLADISTMPRNNGILVDEVMGRVDEENYDNMHNLMNKMLNGYDYILSVNHIKECKDWFNTIIEIEKIDNVSKVTISRK